MCTEDASFKYGTEFDTLHEVSLDHTDLFEKWCPTEYLNNILIWAQFIKADFHT